MWNFSIKLIHSSTFTGRNEPLKKDRPKWKSDYPMTEGQLRSKRDEFWDTAPAFEGRKEIWDALKAAAVALECNDHELAQAIVDGASITLPHGEDRTHTVYLYSTVLTSLSHRLLKPDLTYNVTCFSVASSSQVPWQSVTMNLGTATSCPSTAWHHPSTSSQSVVTKTPVTALNPQQHPRRNSSSRYHD